MVAPRLAPALFLSLILSLPAGAQNGSRLSPRISWAVSALQGWVDSGRVGEPPVPSYVRDAVTGLSGRVAAAPGGEPGLRLLVVTDDPGALESAGYAVGTVAGNVATVEVPVSAIPGLASVPGVRRVQLAMPTRPTMNVSALEVRANVAHGADAPPYPGATGRGVVVGIVDTGLDVNHQDFQNADGTTRVAYLWDQTDNTGPHPAGYDYGTEWTAAQIDGGGIRQRDIDGHGTHVTGIAAGNGRATDSPDHRYTYTGIAPEAEILFVKTNFLETGIIDAVRWIQERAGAEPAVVNLSLGSQFGPHDGTAVLDLAMESMSGPGRILVAAAGNDAGTARHAEAVVAAGGAVELPLQIPAYNPFPGFNNDLLLLDSWFPGSADLRFTVISPNGYMVGPVGADEEQEGATPDGTVFVGNSFYPPDGARNVEIDIYDGGTSAPRTGTWRVRVQNAGPGPDEVDAWIPVAYLGGNSNVHWAAYVDDQETLLSPATSNGVLAVGAYVTKVNWPKFGGGGCGYATPLPIDSIAPFSSLGPRRDGVRKPEISAPGMGIVSSLSANAISSSFTYYCVIATDGVHAVSQGTSQASPHVAGAVALMLEGRPDADFAWVRDRLEQTARQDDYTGHSWSPAFGFGKLDVAAAAALPLVAFLDLAPGACPNPLSFAKMGVLPGVLAGTPGFDVQAVDRQSLRLEGVPAVRTAVEDVIGAAEGEDCPCGDPRPDGRPDLTVKFPVDGLIQALMPVANGEERTLTLTGALRDGTPFTASDCVIIRGAPKDAIASTPGEETSNPEGGTERRTFSLSARGWGSLQRVAYGLPEDSDVDLTVFDVTGRVVERLVRSRVPAGSYSVDWNASGRPNGIYFYRLQAGGQVATRKVVLVR